MDVATIDGLRIGARSLGELKRTEQRLGIRLPPSVREWCSYDGALPILAAHSNDDPPIPVQEFSLTESGAGRLISIRWENQGVCTWAILLDGSDHPPVLVDVDSNGTVWQSLVQKFSTYVYTCVWDHHVVLRRPALVQAQNVIVGADERARDVAGTCTAWIRDDSDALDQQTTAVDERKADSERVKTGVSALEWHGELVVRHRYGWSRPTPLGLAEVRMPPHISLFCLTAVLAISGPGAATAQPVQFRLPEDDPNTNSDVIRSVGFSPDGSFLAVGSGRFTGMLHEPRPGQAVVCSARSGKRQVVIPGRMDGVRSVTFSWSTSASAATRIRYAPTP
jgi:hypothetical protein